MIFAEPMAVELGELTDELPDDIRLLISAMEVGRRTGPDRRTGPRVAYHTAATMRLFVDTPLTPTRMLYTRDVSPRGLGFVSRRPLPLGFGGVLRLRGFDGTPTSVYCTLLRCRPAIHGFFEGSVSFNRDQIAFAG